MRKLSGTQVASLTAIVIAALVAVLFKPLPPLLQTVHSQAWTMLIEWFGVSACGLFLLSWMGVTDMEFEVSSSGITSRQVRADEGTAEELREELAETREGLRRVQRLNRELFEALVSQGRGDSESEERPEDDEDEADG